MNEVRDWLGEAGVVTQKRVLKSRRPYLHLFPRPTGQSHIVKKDNTVAHTVKFIPIMVKATLHHTEQFVDEMIAPTLKETCEKLWRWVYEHIRYAADGENERVRAPGRTAHEGKGDCDCMTGFLDSCLENVRRKTGWRFLIVNRITKYKAGWQHIYPFVITSTGERIFLDCVTEYFNYEEPFTVKEDNLMDLEYLNGFDGMELSEDAYLLGVDNDDEIGKLKIFEKAGQAIKNAVKKTGEVTKKVVHAVNVVNPATLLLRNGFLAAMKTNMLNVAGRMKWSYLSEEKAKAKGFDMNRYAKLRKLRDRMEKTFYGAGGKIENLKEAILTGKGNAGKEVSGFGLIPIYAMQPEGVSVREILGDELYEKANGSLAGTDGLGVVAAAAIGSAAAAIAAIAAAIKDIGELRKGEPNTDNPDASGSTVDPTETEPTTDSGSTQPDGGGSNSGGSNNAKEGDETAVKFLDDPMGWIKENPKTTALVAVGIVGTGFLIYKLTKGKSKESEAERDRPYSKRDRGYSADAREEFHPVTIRG